MKKIFFVLIMFLILIPMIRAEALEDSFYEAEYIDGVFLKKINDGSSSGKYEQMRVFRRSSDGNIVYCIELWESLRSNITFKGYDINQHSYADIDYDTWQKIVLISYYGYGYQEHTDIKWYAITQFMIWRELSPNSNIYFTDTLNGNKIIKYENEINEINQLISSHGILPSFDNETYELSYNDSFTINDENNVLGKFNIVGYTNMSVKKIGNQLTVTKTVPGVSKLTFVNGGKNYDRKPVVYIDSNGQDVLLPGNYDQVKAITCFYLYSSDITVNMKSLGVTDISSSDASFNGTKLQLLDLNKKLVKELIVEKDNKIVFTNIPYGNYYLKQMVSGEGYLLSDDLVFVTIDSNKEEVDFYNQVIKNQIEINKFLNSYLTDSVTIEDGAVFDICNFSGEALKTFTTDNMGNYVIELPYGKYIVKQVFGKRNYSYVQDFIIEVRLHDKTQTFDLFSDELVTNVKLINVDSESNLPILEGGSIFKIIDLDNQKVLFDNLVTDDYGSTDILVLRSGKYLINQIDCVDGYIINENTFEFVVDDALFSLFNGDDCLEWLVPNQKIKSKIEVVKNTQYYLNDELLKTEVDRKLELSIFAKNDIFSKDGKLLYSKDEEVGTIKLVDDRLLSCDLVLGIYYIKGLESDFVEITLDNANTKKIEVVDKVYQYDDTLELEEIVIQVPNTFSYQIAFDISQLFIVGGFIMLGRKKYENI